MAVLGKNVTGVDGFQGKIGSIVFRRGQAGETIGSAMPIKGNQGRQPGNAPAQARMSIIGQYMKRNKFNFRQFFKSNQPYLKGSALFSKLNATNDGPFADPEEPDYSLFKVADGLFTDVNLTVDSIARAGTGIEVTLTNITAPAGTAAKYYFGSIDTVTLSIVYTEGPAVVAGVSQEFTVANVPEFLNGWVGIFVVDNITLMPSPTIATVTEV